MISIAYIINLEHRRDRRERILREIGPVPCSVEVWPACDGALLEPPSDWLHSKGFWGARCSHQNVLDELHRHGNPFPLVLEDDCCFTPGWFDRACQQVQWLETYNPTWRCLYLGGNHANPPVSLNIELGVARAHRTVMMHAVVYNHRHILNMLGALDFFYPMHPDQAFAEAQQYYHIYTSIPNLVGQHPGHSDNNDRHDEGVPIAPIPDPH